MDLCGVRVCVLLKNHLVCAGKAMCMKAIRRWSIFVVPSLVAASCLRKLRLRAFQQMLHPRFRPSSVHWRRLEDSWPTRTAIYRSDR